MVGHLDIREYVMVETGEHHFSSSLYSYNGVFE